MDVCSELTLASAKQQEEICMIRWVLIRHMTTFITDNGLEAAMQAITFWLG
jgi:hypothetical protein